MRYMQIPSTAPENIESIKFNVLPNGLDLSGGLPGYDIVEFQREPALSHPSDLVGFVRQLVMLPQSLSLYIF